ncbi:MAG TPA: hypothetical protein PKK00_03265 [Bacteroidales bacterium]|nr:hypothetical protein [Bacteroidales bacterium]HPS15659.1 hypothetical protein [Bacteroidales bacterium]
MTLKQLVNKAKDKHNFNDLNAYINFCNEYLNFISDNLQAIIVSQNENHYQFYQYKKAGNFQITRPINSSLMYDLKTFSKASVEYIKILKNIKTLEKPDNSIREIINNATYTIQQSIGSALDGLPAGQSNTARKLNGDLFEHFVRLIIHEIGIECKAGVMQVPVMVDGQRLFDMSYQHDLFIEKDNDIKVIGSIKTSSKDRIDKIFIDKFLYNKLTEKRTPHIAIFLNDVQRKNTKKENEYGINSTFLPGHFKGYTVKLNPLDGVYYCDIRPNMKTENILKDHIKTFDNLLIEDIWKFI